jgi:hypothetical protein
MCKSLINNLQLQVLQPDGKTHFTTYSGIIVAYNYSKHA